MESWGQELYFNERGQRAPFTAERKSGREGAHRSAGRAADGGRPERAGKGRRYCSSSRSRCDRRRRVAPLPEHGFGQWRGGGNGRKRTCCGTASRESGSPAQRRRAGGARARPASKANSRKAEGSGSSGTIAFRCASPSSSTRRPPTAWSTLPTWMPSPPASATSTNTRTTSDPLVIPEGDPHRPTDWHDAGRLFPY